MILAVDIGNSNMVIGAIENGNIIQDARVRTISMATATECAIQLADILSYMKMEESMFDGAVVSTVVPQLKTPMREAIQSVLGCDPVMVSQYLDTGVELKIDEPATVAGDLITGAVGAKEYYGVPTIVIDMGTATTMTVLDKEGAFIGGAIMPGIGLGLNALAEGTALLPSISLSAPKQAIGTNTVNCMRSGAVLGSASMLDGMIDRFEQELGYSCNVVATGGLASSVVKNCSHPIICDGELLLKGLWKIYLRNRKNN